MSNKADSTTKNSLPTVGGQAVMEGILMRHADAYSLAVRRPSGAIFTERRAWNTWGSKSWRNKRFLRGFPILVETLSNGIRALNRSADLAMDDESQPMSSVQVATTLLLAIAFAVALFVAVPHIMAWGMEYLGFGGSMESISFHIWDGLFKYAIFVAYLAVISLMPDIRRVFMYHGAEHKSIAAFESGAEINVQNARLCSRLHPRCGTTFLLFVLSVAILLHAVAVPAFLWIWTPENAILKHGTVVLFKIFLIIPVSAVAYELIRYSASLGNTMLGKILRAPGLFLQLLTTREPDDAQLEVAIEALRVALGEEYAHRFERKNNLE